MSSNCITITGGDRIRITRLDGCGRPVYGPCNAVVTKGIVEIKLSPEVEEGDAREQKNFGGEYCYSEPTCDQVKYWTVEVTWCEINIEAFQMLNPNHTILRDENGEVIGYYVSNTVDCSRGYAVEVWMKLAGTSNACTGEEGGGQWGYIPITWINGGVPGEIDIGGEDSITFTTSGKARTGGGWGVGPYDVLLSKGVPAPLPQPLGPDNPYGVLVTGLQPPEAQCECVEVPRPVPTPADLTIDGIAGEDPRDTVQVRVDNHGLGPVTIDWGDGSPVEKVEDLSVTRHKYATDGEHTIKVCDAQDTTVCRTVTITVPLPDDNPALTVTKVDGDDTGMKARATVQLPSQASGTVILDFGDGSDPVEVTADDTGKAEYVYTYPRPGRFAVTAKRKEKPSYRARQVVTVPWPDQPAAPTNLASPTQTATSVDLTWTE